MANIGSGDQNQDTNEVINCRSMMDGSPICVANCDIILPQKIFYYLGHNDLEIQFAKEYPITTKSFLKKLRKKIEKCEEDNHRDQPYFWNMDKKLDTSWLSIKGYVQKHLRKAITMHPIFLSDFFDGTSLCFAIQSRLYFALGCAESNNLAKGFKDKANDELKSQYQKIIKEIISTIISTNKRFPYQAWINYERKSKNHLFHIYNTINLVFRVGVFMEPIFPIFMFVQYPDLNLLKNERSSLNSEGNKKKRGRKRKLDENIAHNENITPN